MSFEYGVTQAGLVPRPGKQAVERRYRPQIDASGPYRIEGSVDLDQQLSAMEPNSARWDYGVGILVGGVSYAIWVEPHGATSTSEVDRVLRKLAWLKAKLNSPGWQALNSMTAASKGRGLAIYYWLAPGTVSFPPTSKEAKRLFQAGIGMPVKKVMVR